MPDSNRISSSSSRPVNQSNQDGQRSQGAQANSGFGFTVNLSSNAQPWIAPPQRYDTTLDCFIREPKTKDAGTQTDKCRDEHAKQQANQVPALERFCGWCGSWFDR